MSSLYLSNFNDEHSLSEYFLKSSLVHIIALLSLFALNWVLGYEGRRLHDENIVLVEGSVRVDVVSMPRMTVRELQTLQELATKAPTAPAPAARPVEQERAAPVPKVADDSQAPVLEQVVEEPKESVMDVLKRTAARGAQESQAQAPTQGESGSGLSPEAQRRLRELVAAGNRLSDGASLVGSGSGAEMTAFNTYILGLPDIVRVNWRLPSFLRDEELRARVRIYLRANGELIRAELYESSGNDEYDRRALDAVRQSAPFPAMESEIASRAQRGDIVLGFPL